MKGATLSEIQSAVETARSLLSDCGYDCRTTAEDFMLWFQADTPYDQGGEFDCVIHNPLLVAHELVEIENVKAMGLELTKDVIIKNMQKVDDAHLEATRVEMELAMFLGNTEHVIERVDDISMWINDPSVTPERKGQYGDLRSKMLEALARLKGSAAYE